MPTRTSTVRFKQDLCPAHQRAYLRPHLLRRGSSAPPCSTPTSASAQSRPGADAKLAPRMCAQLALHRWAGEMSKLQQHARGANPYAAWARRRPCLGMLRCRANASDAFFERFHAFSASANRPRNGAIFPPVMKSTFGPKLKYIAPNFKYMGQNSNIWRKNSNIRRKFKINEFL